MISLAPNFYLDLKRTMANLNPTMINILNWNYRGWPRDVFENALHYIIAKHHHDVLFLMDTKAMAQDSMDIISRFGYDSYHVISTLRFCGGLWLLWKRSSYEIQVVQTSDCSLHALITVQPYIQILFTGLYAHPHRPLWNEL